MSAGTTPFDSMIARDYREIGMESPLERHARKTASSRLYTRLIGSRERGKRALAVYGRVLRSIDPALKPGLTCFYAPNGWTPARSSP